MESITFEKQESKIVSNYKRYNIKYNYDNDIQILRIKIKNVDSFGIAKQKYMGIENNKYQIPLLFTKNDKEHKKLYNFMDNLLDYITQKTKIKKR